MLEGTTAELSALPGLPLAPTAKTQTYLVTLGDIPGGKDAFADWIVRGDTTQMTVRASEIALETQTRRVAGNTVAQTIEIVEREVAISSTALRARRLAEARIKGYEGDACGNCGNFTLVRNGTCMKCDSCGTTTGCS